MKKFKIIALIGKAGSGKDTLLQRLLKNNEEKAYAAWNLAVQNKHFDKIDS